MVDTVPLLADGFDEALVGVLRRCGQPEILAYSYEKAVEILVDRGATHEEAVEHLEFNVVGAWVGEGTPAWLMGDPEWLQMLLEGTSG